MERRAGSHTEEEELNLRRKLLNQARKGDPKAISRLFELYQVRVYTGEALSKGKVPKWPNAHQKAALKKGAKSTVRTRKARVASKRSGRKPARRPRRKR